MQAQKVANFYCWAYVYVAKHYPKDITFAQTRSLETFRCMGLKKFFYSYVWAVYTSGFKVEIVGNKFPALEKAYQDFDVKKICRMRSLKGPLSVFKNERKANCVLKGAMYIERIGFDNLKKRILNAINAEKSGADILEKLSGIGPITKNLLAKDTGIESVAKNDVHIQKLVKLFLAENHLQMVTYLSEKFQEKQNVIDSILWRFCEQKAWKDYGYLSLKSFVSSCV